MDGAAKPSLVLSIESLAAGGDGVGHLDGKTVFVPGTVPGDRVRVELAQDRGSYAHAQLLELIEASPERVEAPCPVAGSCGGCQWQQVDNDSQRRARVAIIEAALERIAGLETWPALVWDGDGEDLALGYRRRAEYHAEKRAGESLRFGFFARGSQNIVEHESCLLLLPALREAMTELGEYLRLRLRGTGRFVLEATLLPGPALQLVVQGEERLARGLVACLEGWSPPQFVALHLQVRVLESGRMLRAAPGPFALDTLALPALGGQAGELTLLTRPGDFIQAHDQANARLLSAVLAALGEEELAASPWILDLYCGVGNIGLGLAMAGARVMGLEWRRSALRSARRSARMASLARARFRPGRVAELLPLLVTEGKTYSTVVLDPPRKGAPELADFLDPLQVQRILALSCHPASFARDLKGWQSRGFVLRGLRLFDFFPQTHHVELLADLSREA